MAFMKNEFGVPQFPPSDARRLFVLLGAIELLERPTQSAIADLTSHQRDAIDEEIDRLREEYGVVVHKVGEVYHISSWGNILKKNAVKRFIQATH